MIQIAIRIAAFLATCIGGIVVAILLQTASPNNDVAWTAIDSPDIASEAQSAPYSGQRLIVAGQSVGSLFLGDKREKALATFGNPDAEVETDVTSPRGFFRKKELRFLETEQAASHDNPRHGYGTWVDLINDNVTQIRIESPAFSTIDGVSVMTSPAKILELYPKIEGWVRMDSNCEYELSGDPIFLVEKSNGIAFEIQSRGHFPGRKVVAGIFVFKPHGVFIPRGFDRLNWQCLRLVEPSHLSDLNVALQNKGIGSISK